MIIHLCLPILRGRTVAEQRISNVFGSVQWPRVIGRYLGRRGLDAAWCGQGAGHGRRPELTGRQDGMRMRTPWIAAVSTGVAPTNFSQQADASEGSSVPGRPSGPSAPPAPSKGTP